MAFARNITYDEINPNFLDNLQSDFRILAQETKKKYPQVREACEEAISKICRAYQQMPVYYLVNQILYPLVRGCETKDSKIIKLSLGVMQKLINQQVVDQKGARYITDALWLLMDNNLEELKILQTILLLITSNTVVRGETLSKSLVLCFRLYYVKNSTIGNIAGATIRQLVSLVYERVITEQECLKKENENIMAKDKFYPLRDEGRSCATDAYLLFQDLVYLVNAEQAHWLIGMTGMTETFGLDLLEAVLINFSEVFTQISSFTTLLKEKMCALIIKLFSPNVKHHITQTGNHGELSDMYSFQINIRLLRLTSTLIQKYHRILVTECEIFLSLIVRILETNKPIWQKALTLEAVHKISANPEILASICGYYDLKHHATDIFKNLIKAVATITKTDLHNETSEAFNQMPISNRNESQTMDGKVQAGIVFKGTWLQIVSQYPTGPPKYFYLDMLDKSEPPAISEDYCVSMAYIILLETMHSISTLIEETTLINDEPMLKYQLITSSWCGILPAIMTLLDATFEEAMIEKILQTITNFIQLCGSLEMYAPRDAYIHALCQSCLPHHFPLLNATNHGFDYNKYYNKSKGHDSEGQDVGLFSENETCQHIVAIGTPLPNSAIHPSFQQGPVILTTKNLLCMKAVLQMSHHHGAILGSSWHVVLSTIQHLVWILGLKPSTGGSLQAGPKSTIDSSTGIQTAVLIDLQNLSQMVSQIFESSQFLDDCALHHLIDALCKLSHEAMELAYANREPSLFAVAKLLETGIVNLPRIEVLWRPLATHFLQVCHHRHIRMREWGVEAITYLVRCAMQFKYNLPLKGNMALQTSLLNPLAELSLVLHGNVRQKQLECILQILNGNGENISFAWPLILDIIGAVNNHQGEVLIRTAFQCLQLVITDFLHVMPSSCLPLCINTAAKFGSQTKELNISLTAIGLMWNISDFFNQNQEKLSQTNFNDSCIYPNFAGITDMPQLDRLWMCLFTKLGELCVDLRPAVRKSASQTLFSTISANGNLLVTATWQAVLWQVLFPLLGDVQNLSNTASNEKVDTSGNILIHHSRNTAQKQWAETQVLTLLGVSRVFSIYREVLQQLDDFPKAWTALLDFIENAALSKNNEVSLAAVKSYQEIMFIEPADCEQSKLAHFNDI